MPYKLDPKLQLNISDEAYDTSGVHLELTGNGCNMNSYKRFNSSSRETMRSASHLPQTPVIYFTTPRRISTLAEREYGVYTTAITMPVDGTVVKVIPKYTVSHGYGGIKACPFKALVYDNSETGEVDMLQLDSVRADHVTFGYKYHEREVDVRPGAGIGKGTTLASSTNLKEDGEYNIGLEANVIFMAHPACIEDGIVITDHFATKLGADTIVDRVMSFDKYTIPLNLYGKDVDDYRIIPDIGTPCAKDGVLYATRNVCPLFGFVTLSKKELRRIRTTDKVCRVPSGSIVNDIDGFSGRTKPTNRLPQAVTGQADYYVGALSDYYASIRAEYNRIRKANPNVRFGPNFHNTIVRAISDDPNSVPYRVSRLYRRATLQDYRIEIRLISKLLARVGHKLTDLHGGKAVAVSIIPQADAPMDKFGTYADIIIDGTTCNDRINPGRLYEQYTNASGTQLVRNLANEQNMLVVFEKLMEWYAIVSPPMHEAVMQTMVSDDAKRRHARWTLRHQPHVWMPPNAKGVGPEQVRQLESKFKLDYGPVTYRNLVGETVTTKDNMFIGSIYFILLEKIGDDWASVSVAKLQSFGLPAKISAADKHTSQVRERSVRILGETEVRLLTALMGGEVTNKLLLLASSPARQKQAVRAIYEADHINDIDSIENYGPKGESMDNRALQYITMLLHCFGCDIEGGNSIRNM